MSLSNTQESKQQMVQAPLQSGMVFVLVCMVCAYKSFKKNGAFMYGDKQSMQCQEPKGSWYIGGIWSSSSHLENPISVTINNIHTCTNVFPAWPWKYSEFQS